MKKEVNKEDKKKIIQGILFDESVNVGEKDDDEGYYKNELADKRRAEYYRGKRLALILEEKNNSKLILFPSLGGSEREWYKMGGVSALIYKYRIGPRLGRKPKIQRDNDKRERFINGITSIHWLEKFSEVMKGIGYEKYDVGEYGVVSFDLGQKFSEVEIRELREQGRRERELFQDMVKPVRSFPEIYAHFIQLAQILPKKVQKMEMVQRELFGKHLALNLVKIGEIYYRLTDGLMNEKDAKIALEKTINDMLAVLVIIDEAGLMPEVGLLRIGTILADLKDATERMFEKKLDKRAEEVGSLAKK